MSDALFNRYLETLRPRFESDGFTLHADEQIKGHSIPLTASRSRFELSKFGYSEVFFSVGKFGSPTPQELKQFSSLAFDYALLNKKIGLPRGFFESVWSYSVAVCDSISEDSIRFIEETAPEKHWAAAEIPAAFSLDTQTLYYFKKTPLWGAAYYSSFRKTIQKMLKA